jgi:hypothetical protein
LKELGMTELPTDLEPHRKLTAEGPKVRARFYIEEFPRGGGAVNIIEYIE